MIAPGDPARGGGLVVVDASVVVLALTASPEEGAWARDVIATRPPASPHLMPCEVAHVLRRGVLAGRLSAADAAWAHARLADLLVDLLPYEPFAPRVRELRDTLTPYDAWNVAAAEALKVPLATADRRLLRAPGPQCGYLVPPDPGAAWERAAQEMECRSGVGP